MKGDVSREIQRQVENISIQGIKEEVIRRAKEQVTDKLEAELDGITDSYNRQLNDIAKIYRSISKSFMPDN